MKRAAGEEGGEGVVGHQLREHMNRSRTRRSKLQPSDGGHPGFLFLTYILPRG